jgi:hypothetical protein
VPILFSGTCQERGICFPSFQEASLFSFFIRMPWTCFLGRWAKQHFGRYLDALTLTMHAMLDKLLILARPIY